MRRLLTIAAIVMCMFGATSAHAAKPTVATGTIEPVGVPTFGEPVFFDYELDRKVPGNSQLNIAVNCYQDGVWKWQFVDWADQAANPGMGWPLGGPGSSWETDNGQPSSCTAVLFYYSKSRLVVVDDVAFSLVASSVV